MATAMTTGSARASTGSFLVLLFVALAGAAAGASATVAFSSGDSNAAALLTTPASASPGQLNGIIQCLLGCFTEVFGCSFGCMGKQGADLPLCIISCDQKSVVCMIRCGLAPSPPSPPTPKPPTPKPPTPPKPPGPPYTPPYAVTGRKTATSA